MKVLAVGTAGELAELIVPEWKKDSAEEEVYE